MKNAVMTVFHNGVLIHHAVALEAETKGGLREEEPGDGPLLLQAHGDPIHFRNVWFRRL